MNIGLIGCGRIFNKHIEAIKSIDFFKLKSLCEVDPNKIELLKSSYKVPVYDNLDDFLNNNNLDIVSVCSPSGLHPTHSIACANAGLDVVSEKPMATRWNEAKKMISVFDNKKKNLFIVKQNRLNPTIKLLKSALEKNELGRIYMINANVFWCRPQNYYDQDDWRGTWELDGGALMNQASHYVDLLDWLFGPIERVHCFSSTLSRNIEVEDSAVVNLRWRTGALGSLNVTMLAYNKNYEGSITVLGEKGIIKLSGQALNQIDTWNINGVDLKEKYSEKNYEIENVYGNGHKYFYESLMNFYKKNINELPSGREGLRSLELLVSFYLSSREERSVSLPFDI